MDLRVLGHKRHGCTVEHACLGVGIGTDNTNGALFLRLLFNENLHCVQLRPQNDIGRVQAALICCYILQLELDMLVVKTVDGVFWRGNDALHM